MEADETVCYRAARLFDGMQWHEQASLLVADGTIAGFGEAPDGGKTIELGDRIIVPGLVDLQCNGGGGVMLTGDTDWAGLGTILDTHAQLGTLYLLPTLITTTAAATDHVMTLGAQAARLDTSGFLGLHLEGPHLSLARKGAHDPALIRPMTEADIVRLERARAELPHLVVTVAAETVPPEAIARLVRAGIVVSIGHSDASYEQAITAFRAGATMSTHLFNAMSQLGNRQPGLVGAVLDSASVSAGVIADGIHIHPATLRAAIAAKRGPGEIFLVSDSMAQAGTNWTNFTLGSETIIRAEGALRLSDGTLAGADLTMMSAVMNWVRLGLGSLDEAIERATSLPLKSLGIKPDRMIKPGDPPRFIVLDPISGVQLASNMVV